MRGGREQLADEVVLAGAMLEVDEQPVEAGQRARLGGERGAEVEERAQRRLARPQPLAQRGAHPCHRWVASPAAYSRRFSSSHG